MNQVFILVLLNDDDSIREIISAHGTASAAKAAERFYRGYTASPSARASGIRADIVITEFGV